MDRPGLKPYLKAALLAWTSPMAETPEIGGKTEELVLHGEEHGSGTLPQLDTSTYPSQLLWLVIVFGALYLLLSKVLLPKIANALETRQSRIAADLAQAEQLNDDARKASEAYDAALADARAKANAIAQENRAEVLKELEAEQSKVDAQLADKLATAEKQIASTREKAMGEVENIAGQLVDDVVQELTGSKPSAAAVKSAIAAANR
jgi:F-type H+-transporting ATPase subunit b